MDNTQTPLAPFQQPEPIQQPEPLQKKGWGKKVVAPVLALLVLTLGGVCYWQYSEANQANTAKQSATERVATLEGEVSGLKDQLQTATAAAASTTSYQGTTTSSKTDAEMITSVVTTYIHGQKGNANAKVDMDIDKITLPFARVQIPFAYDCILKKVDNVWIQLYCGQGASDYTQHQDEVYEVPSSFALQ